MTAWDADVFPPEFPGGDFDLVLIPVSSYEGIEVGAQLAARFKTAGAPRVLAFGQYAWLNAAALAAVTDGVPADEPEGMTGWLLAYASGQAGSTTTGNTPTPPSTNCGHNGARKP